MSVVLKSDQILMRVFFCYKKKVDKFNALKLTLVLAIFPYNLCLKQFFTVIFSLVFYLLC